MEQETTLTNRSDFRNPLLGPVTLNNGGKETPMFLPEIRQRFKESYKSATSIEKIVSLLEQRRRQNNNFIDRLRETYKADVAAIQQKRLDCHRIVRERSKFANQTKLWTSISESSGFHYTSESQGYDNLVSVKNQLMKEKTYLLEKERRRITDSQLLSELEEVEKVRNWASDQRRKLLKKLYQLNTLRECAKDDKIVTENCNVHVNNSKLSITDERLPLKSNITEADLSHSGLRGFPNVKEKDTKVNAAEYEAKENLLKFSDSFSESDLLESLSLEEQGSTHMLFASDSISPWSSEVNMKSNSFERNEDADDNLRIIPRDGTRLPLETVVRVSPSANKTEILAAKIRNKEVCKSKRRY